MRRRLLLLSVILSCAWRASAVTSVVVVHGSETVPVAERGFARSLARHAVRAFREAGLEVDLRDDAQLANALADRRLAVLVYVSQPQAAHVAAIKGFLERGGRLIVCYSASPALADLMGVRLGGYVRSSTDGRWSGMRFGPSRPRGVPEQIEQVSPNLMLAQPVPGRSEVLAWWTDRQGRTMPEPAWLVTRQGYWMTHVLLADGDAAAKSRLLLALAASCDATLWAQAAAPLLAGARRVGELANPAAAEAAAGRLTDPVSREKALAAARSAARLEARASQLLRTGPGYEAWEAAAALRTGMFEVYGLLQAPRAGEMRALWEHSGMGLYPGDWPRTCRVVKEAGFSDLMVNVAGAGFAHYRSEVLPASRVFAEQGDQLAACLAAARPLGLRVHAWILCFSTTQSTADRMAAFRQQGWLLTGEDGRERPWLDPAVPEVRLYLTRAVGELAGRYPVDGVHLDFVRYPDYTGSLGPSVRPRFERDIGRTVAAWPQDVKAGGRYRAEFMRWRSGKVTDFLAAARLQMRREAPGRMLTAAVFGKYPSCVDAVGQDWHAWIEQGLVDYVLPMNYTEDPAVFSQLVRDQSANRALRRRMLPGIGVTAAESRLDPAQVVDQIRLVRQYGCPGFALFDLDATLQQQILPVLRLGATAE